MGPYVRGMPADLVELSRAQCLDLLAAHHFGRVVVAMANGQTVIRPVNYVFDRGRHAVAFRSAPGSKLHALLRASRAKFEIDGFDDASRTGWSVIIEGPPAEVTSPPEIRRLDALGLEPWAPGAKLHWVEVQASTVSGRRIGQPAASEFAST